MDLNLKRVRSKRKFAFATVTVIAFLRYSAVSLPPLSAVANISLEITPCKRADIRGGKWVERTIVDEQDSINNVTLDSPIPPTQYLWSLPHAASSCQFLEEFDSTSFCRLMANSVVLFIGDSITWEMYESLVHLVGGRVSKRVHNRAIHKKVPIVVNVCGNYSDHDHDDAADDVDYVTLVYRWSKHLDGSGTSVSIDRMLEEQFPAAAIVMNTGSHYQSDDVHRGRVDHALVLVKGWQRFCRDRIHVTCPFYWRTTAPGTPNCMNFTAPVNDVSRMEKVVASRPMYNWENFRRQNEAATRTLESSNLSSYEVIDGYEIDIQRPDLHVSESDCLHHASPAVADAYNVVLLHHLRATRTMEDVSRLAKYKYPFSRVSNVHPSGKDLDWERCSHALYPCS